LHLHPTYPRPWRHAVGSKPFSDDFVHAALLAEKGIDYIDADVSGGVWG
jgi:6-phosphogluconate dehydrogenase (decarboxylating)